MLAGRTKCVPGVCGGKRLVGLPGGTQKNFWLPATEAS
jgi:hypothetical protein